MLKIFNDLSPFFEDNYRRINVREYARIRKVSPPSASKRLQEFEKEGLLRQEKERKYIFYVAKRDGAIFQQISKIYWSLTLEKAGVLDEIEKTCIAPIIVLFGSLSKSEVKKGSDVDLAIFTASERKINAERLERKLRRKIQVFYFRNRKEVKSEELLSNILNGHKLRGDW